ncbi:MAG: HEAT repeat domain-containing protein [Chloroflexi bacterium]|nr:HEAT repeat domain-containing protein [Chloroflexota bacterium]
MGLFGPPDVEKMKAKRDVKGLIKALRYEKDWEIRKSAAAALGKICDASAVEPLVAALKDSNEHVRGYATEALGKIRDVRAVEPLITTLADSHLGVRTNAVYVLGMIGDARAVKPLIAELKDIHFRHIRITAADALGKIGDVRAVGPLIATLRDGDMDVRKHAAEALGKIGWQPDKSETGALYWIALGNWNNCVIVGSSAIEPLIVLLYHENWDLRASVARALVSIYHKAALSDEERLRILSKRNEIISPTREEHIDWGNKDCSYLHDDRYAKWGGVDFPL